MQFIVRAFDVEAGIVVERLLRAESIQHARAQMAAEKLSVLTIAPQGAAAAAAAAARPAVFDVALFCAELGTLLSSGMSLIEAVDTLATKGSEAHRHAVLAELGSLLREGKALSTALERSQHPFPILLIASVRASERTSRLEDALAEYTAYDQAGRELLRKVTSATIYPLLVIGFGFAVSLFMIAYVVPRFAKVYDDFAQSLSVPTLILMRVGQFASDYLWLILLTLGGIAATLLALQRRGVLKRSVLALVGRSRLANRYLQIYQLARIFQTMSMLLRGGFTLSDAIQQAQALAFTPTLQASLQQASAAIAEGKRMSAAFAACGLGDSVAERLLQVGERSGNLSKVLDIISQSYRHDLTVRLERLTRLAEPILLMAVGLMVGGIIILMYMPVFDLAGTL
jgi:general secretion pathway protein F